MTGDDDKVTSREQENPTMNSDTPHPTPSPNPSDCVDCSREFDPAEMVAGLDRYLRCTACSCSREAGGAF